MACLNCIGEAHERADHCGCGSVCMHCDCPRFMDESGLAPCTDCDKADKLVKVPVGDGRDTYVCTRCNPEG